MASPNLQLEGALGRFAARPGTPPEQAAALRAVIASDSDLLAQLNREAAAGQVRDFAVQAPGGTPNLTGVYDKPTGLVTLPADSFQSAGGAANANLREVIRLQAMTVDLAHATWQDASGQTRTVSQDMVSNMQSTLNESPALAAQIKEAVRLGHVRHFGLLDSRMAAGATYDGQEATAVDPTPKGINLPPQALQTNTASPGGRFDARDMTFVLGHEIQHGFNDAMKDQAHRDFLRAIDQQAHIQAPVHDYTIELRDYLQAGRDDEAQAQIAGWNALLSRERQVQPSANGPHLLLISGNNRVLDFVTRDPLTSLGTPRPGIIFNADGSLTRTPANIAAMGQHYFDRPSPLHAQPGERPLGIGEHRPQPSADYANYYGTWALEQIVAAEDRANVIHAGARPVIAIDMASLGLKEDLIEKEGLNLGASKAPRPYLDTSQVPAVQGRFDHTQDGSVNPRHDHQHVPVVGHHPATLLQDPTTPDQPGHPDHALLEKLRGDVRHLDANAGKGWDTASERLAASALVMAKEKGFTAQDDLQLAFNTGTPTLAPGELLHLYRQGPSASPDPAANRACIRTLEALATPVDARYEQADAAGIARDRTQAQQVEQQHRVMQDEGARAHHAGGM